jgi:hypothetical protein
MRLRSGLILSSLSIVLFSSSPAFSQNAAVAKSDERHIGRIIGVSAGAVGGFFLGYSLSDDDAINATQKMTRNVVIGAIAGAIGGYFAGRAVDKKVSYARAPDSLTRSLAQAKAAESLASEGVFRSGAKSPERTFESSCPGGCFLAPLP